MRTRSCLVLLLAASSFAVARPAAAGNTDSFYYSDDAAMAAGAVIATTRDAGAIWYNPAGLGGIRRGQIDLSGTTFAFRIRSANNALTSIFPDGARSIDLASSDFFSAPHALTLIRNVSEDVSMGFGLYVTTRDVHSAQNETTFASVFGGGNTTPTQMTQRLDLSTDTTRYHAGPSIGWQLAPSFRVGLSLFATYSKESGFAQYLIRGQAIGAGATDIEFLLAQNRIAFTYVGTQAVAGVQWDPSTDWHLGLVVRSPEFLLTASADGASFQSLASVAASEQPQAAFVLQHPNATYPAFTVVAPMRVVAGIARPIAPGTWISAEADYQTAVDNQGIDLAPTINARIGARIRTSDRWSFGVGAFTDRSTLRDVGPALNQDKVDYYGATAGFEMRTPVSLTTNPAPDALVLSTTLALRYAIGIGDARAANLDFTGGSPPPRTVSVVYHEFIPYVGTGILF